MPVTLTVQARIIGQKAPLVRDVHVSVDDSRPLTLKDLITQIVRGEVADFEERQAERRLVRVLTAAQIEQGIAQGKVEMGGSDLNQVVDAESAIAVALQAFRDGIVLAFIDDVQVQQLEAPLALKASSTVKFVRLVMLAGG